MKGMLIRTSPVLIAVSLLIGGCAEGARVGDSNRTGALSNEAVTVEKVSGEQAVDGVLPDTEAHASRQMVTPDVAATSSNAATESPAKLYVENQGGDDEKSRSPLFSSIEWTQWRGPGRDGRVRGATAPRAWPKVLKERWRTIVGVGHSSPVVWNKRVFQFARIGEEEVLMALDAATGKQLWRSSVPVAYELNAAARDHGKGPKSTPVVASGKVFTLGIAGLLSAHDAATGKLVWRRGFSKEYERTSPLYGTAMSPVVEKNLVIAHVGGHDGGALTAFDMASGAVKWRYDADGPAYSSPVVADFGGVRQLITFTQRELVSVAAATGVLLWKLPAKTHYDTNSNTPVVYKDTVIVSMEGRGIVALRPAKRGGVWVAEEIWRNSEHELYMNTPVLRGDQFIGFSARRKGQFFALEASNGKTIWQGPGRAGENAAILNVAGTLLFLTNDAGLIVLPADAKEYHPVARYTVASSPTWAHPVFLGDRILVKDENSLASLALD